MKYCYEIALTTENTLRVLQRITTVFSRNRINIEKLNVFETEVSGISHFNIVIHVSETVMQKTLRQLEKIVEVIEVDIQNKTPLPESGTGED